ncbi:Hamartin protein-domain-containing protein [Protomyces lactucae-debilis]|uniref:Hamartin protein-domain-containing protein n=1 Tax=Protomyces lactucae-debilis TaxID=2754530 RepID=A0A1Y2FBV9_PROLT|nr:Hamartin protein-domain-containing protein [Protomyces lactucae-debilis]ORY81402.1 Hamartin protein-domain-containing protein [Protomyces lactucae-debilis]
MSGSLASLGKALHAAFAQPQIALSPELLQVIETYLDKHKHPSENDSSRLHEELCAIHKEHVRGTDRNAAFLHILRLLRHQMIIDADQCVYWWDAMIGPIIGNIEQSKRTLKDAKDICLDMMVVSDDEAESEFKQRNATAERVKRCMLEAYFAAQSQQLDNVAVNLEICLVAYARRRTKDFFETIVPHLQDKHNRLQCLTLLSTFVRLQTQYIYTCCETPLLNTLLLCLEHDASTSVISLALTILIMMLPHIPDKLGQILPRCFQIFGRILCWDRIGAVQRRTAAMLVETSQSILEKEKSPEASSTLSGEWQRLEASFDIVHSTPPKSAQYFTFLYGLYPINFLDYLRAPSLYLQARNFVPNEALEDFFEDEIIKSRAEPLIRRHLLHPNLSTLTLDSEVSDVSRWMKMEPSDVVALCISLDTINIDAQSKLQSLRYSDTADDDVTPVSLDASKTFDEKLSPIDETDDAPSANFSMMDSFMSGDSVDIPPAASRLASPAFGPTPYRSSSAGESLGRRESGKRSSVALTEILRVHEKLLDHTPSTTTAPEDELHADVSYYQREVLLLRNELHFERHLKQQHLQHIGRLQRSNIADAAVETERQNLYNTTKALKSQVANLQGSLQRLRNETATSKANRLDYEATLNERIKQLRQERTVWTSTEKSMRTALEEARADVQSMRYSLGVAEGVQLNLRQQLQVLEPEIQETRELKQNIDLLKQRMKEAEVQDIQLRMEKERVAEAVARAKASQLALEAVKQEFAAFRQEEASRATSQDAIPLHVKTAMVKPELIAEMLAHAKSRQVSEHEALQDRHAILRKRYGALEAQLDETLAKLEIAELTAQHAIEREAKLSQSANLPMTPGQAPSPLGEGSPQARSERSESIASTSTSGTVDAGLVHGARRRSIPHSATTLASAFGNENAPVIGERTPSAMTLPARHQTEPIYSGERSPALAGGEGLSAAGSSSTPSIASRSTAGTSSKAKQEKTRTPMPISMYGPLVPPKTKTAPPATTSKTTDTSASGGQTKKTEQKMFAGRFSRWS